MGITHDEITAIATIYATVVIGVLWALYNGIVVMGIKVDEGYTPANQEDLKERNVAALKDIGNKIADGASAFLKAEYTVMLYFVAFFSIVVFLLVDLFGQDVKDGETRVIRFYATVAFIIGSITSIFCGFIGMRIAVEANYRTTFKAISSLQGAFNTAYQAGCVMGFAMCALALGVLITILIIYITVYDPIIVDEARHHISTRSYQALMDLVAGYGLGGSSMALFGRVGGGIYTKAADVGADLVGKVEEGLEEDSPKNPATIADNVGDNVGDIAGMGSDLFGSFAESTCAALVLIAGSDKLLSASIQSLYFPLLISAGGIVACLFTSIFGIFIYKVDNLSKIEKALNLQLMISTIFMLIILYPICTYFLPDHWDMNINNTGVKTVKWWYCYVCTAMGLLSGFVIGLSTDYYTSNAHYPVQEMAGVCTSGAAINVIYGLALGYLSCIIPIILLSITIIVNVYLLGMLGVALGAIGMLSTLAICLAIDSYGPISDNAGGIAEMTEIGDDVRKKTDALDAAGNTTAAVGKGFAIGSAALVSLALYGAFLTRCAIKGRKSFSQVIVNDGWIFGSMFIGAMLPYFFSALTMKSVGKAANEMVEEVRRQFEDPRIKNGEIDPDYEECIKVSTKASIREMIAPGMLVIFTPIFFGVLFHPKLVAGVLPGALLSGIQLAISMSNTGGAWDNAKKHIESGQLVDDNGKVLGKGSDAHTAAVTGDTIGDPLKDTSGPSLNILVKLMAIISLVFASGFRQTAWLSGPLDIN